MATITRYVPFRSPFNDLAVLQNRLNSIFSDFSRTDGDDDQLSAGNFVPAVDVYEDDQHLSLKFEVPGINPGDLDIRVEGRTLTVRGERKWESDHKEENYHRIERRFGSFARTFTLPATVDTENVQAETDKGVLKITLNKKPEAKPKQIQVKAMDGSSKQIEGAKQPAK